MINHNLNRHKKITRQRTRRNTRRHMKGGWTPKKNRHTHKRHKRKQSRPRWGQGLREDRSRETQFQQGGAPSQRQVPPRDRCRSQCGWRDCGEDKRIFVHQSFALCVVCCTRYRTQREWSDMSKTKLWLRGLVANNNRISWWLKNHQFWSTSFGWSATSAAG